MKTITVIIPGNNVKEYLKLKSLGYVTLWTGNGKICMKKEGK